MVFWAGGMVNVMQDSPSDPVMMFTNANVKDGMFSYKDLRVKTVRQWLL